jgi:exosortase N
MVSSAPLLKYGWKKYGAFLMLLLMAVAGAVIAFPLSFVSKANLIAGLCLFPFTLFFSGRARWNFFYLAMMAFSVFVACAYNVRTFYFFGIAWYVLFILELHFGRLNWIILFMLVCMSPFFEQVAVTLGFPIRLQLSACAGWLLRHAGFDVAVDGNMILLRGNAFSVDEVCMGLNMVSISMLVGVYMIGHHYRAFQNRLSIPRLSVFFLFVMAFNITCNLLRIICIVVFEIPPGNLLHELIGIISVAFYVMLPAYFTARWFVQKYGTVPQGSDAKMPVTRGKWFLYLCGILIIVSGIVVRQVRERTVMAYPSVTHAGFQKTNVGNGITKLYNDKMLVYVKSIPDFFSGEHTPLICWKGSGFDIQTIRTIRVAGTEVYTARLINDREVFFTAWWYSNGRVATIDQLDWRLRMFTGESQFCLVNVTAQTESQLLESVKSLLKNDLLAINRTIQ